MLGDQAGDYSLDLDELIEMAAHLPQSQRYQMAEMLQGYLAMAHYGFARGSFCWPWLAQAIEARAAQLDAAPQPYRYSGYVAHGAVSTAESVNQRLAGELRQLQAPLNDGRGVACARSLAAYLEAGQMDQARACAANEWDKLESHPALAQWLIGHGLYVPVVLS